MARVPAGGFGRRSLEELVSALAGIIAGHELHHRAILETRYLAGSPA